MLLPLVWINKPVNFWLPSLHYFAGRLEWRAKITPVYTYTYLYEAKWLIFPKYPPVFPCSSDRVLLHSDLPVLVLKPQQLWKCKKLTRGNEIRIDLHWALVGYFLLWKGGQPAKIVLRFITKENALGPFLIIGKINGFWVKSVSGPLKVRCQSVCSLLVSARQEHFFNT